MESKRLALRRLANEAAVVQVGMLMQKIPTTNSTCQAGQLRHGGRAKADHGGLGVGDPMLVVHLDLYGCAQEGLSFRTASVHGGLELS